MKRLNIFIIISIIIISFKHITGDECSDFENYKKKLCESIEINSGRCALIGDSCIEVPEKCSSYKGDNKLICESIKPGYNCNDRCIFENNTCTIQYATCSDFKPTDPDYYCKSSIETCFFDKENKICKKKYETCDIANDKEFCESIVLIKQNKKCVWKNDACIEEPVKACSEINYYNCECYGRDCFIPENRKKECYPVNNECKEVYMDCKDYVGNSASECESINVHYSNYLHGTMASKCIFENNICTKVKKNSCSESQSEAECPKIILDDNKKYCYFYNGKCNEYYKECSDYNGTNQDECEKNIPTDLNIGSFFSKYVERKCVFQNNKCITKTISSCSESTKISLCKNIKHFDENKMCKEIDGECKENWKFCSDVPRKNRAACLSNSPITGFKICFMNEYGFCEGVTSSFMECSLFPKLIIADKCEAIVPSNKSKKCVFSNNNCYEVDKQCLDYKSGATKEICEKVGSTSANKMCVLSQVKDECLEVAKGQSLDGNNNEGNKQNEPKEENKQEEKKDQNGQNEVKEEDDEEEEESEDLKNKSSGKDWLKPYIGIYIILILLY